MKKIGKILLVFVAVLFVTGCGCEKKSSEKAMSAEETFETSYL